MHYHATGLRLTLYRACPSSFATAEIIFFHGNKTKDASSLPYLLHTCNSSIQQTARNVTATPFTLNLNHNYL